MKRVLSLLLVVGLLLGCGVSAFAAAAPAGHVFVAVSAPSLGVDEIYPAARVPYYEGENLTTVLWRYLGVENIDIQTMGVYAYINGITLPKDIKVKVAENVLADIGGALLPGAALEGEILQSGDYAALGGWLYFVDNVSPAVSISDYEIADGQVLTLEYSLNGGTDIGLEGWDGSPALVERTDRTGSIRTWAVPLWFVHLPAWLQFVIRYPLLGILWLPIYNLF
ncbi:MAG: DUF4430 domain-containing protein [Oscillospiraceae bacterium]|nr:DUF4430 domain-containing protein [Oscillospiraceae bacterium]